MHFIAECQTAVQLGAILSVIVNSLNAACPSVASAILLSTVDTGASGAPPPFNLGAYSVWL